jgi:ATP-binding cassette subfamily B protein
VDALFSTGVITLVANLVRLLTAAVAMVALSPPLTLIALLVVPPLALITRWFQVRVRAAERRNRRAIGLLNTHLQETLGGVEVIRAFGREMTFIARFRLALREALAAFNGAAVYSAIYSPIMALLSASAIALLLWVGTGGIGVDWGITIGTLTAFVLLFQRFFEPITTLGDDWQTVQSALSGIERIIEVLALPAEIQPDAQPAERCRDTIIIRDLAFGYVPDRPVLRGVSLSVQAGEHVALVGRTGAGKSSMVHLIGGLYAPWSGTVQIAGRDPRSLSDDERRRVVAVVPQQVQLFSGTVRDNLTLGDETVPGEAIARAAAIAGAAGFIEALPQGYDTLLSGSGRGGGTQLSAGQRQLLALARALVWNSTLLLLDEATAAIDSTSEAAFWAALRADVARHGRAVLIVAHRLTTARAADRVIVVEAGRIIEEGPPEELVRRGGRFAALIELEAAGWNWQAGPVLNGSGG